MFNNFIKYILQNSKASETNRLKTYTREEKLKFYKVFYQSNKTGHSNKFVYK